MPKASKPMAKDANSRAKVWNDKNDIYTKFNKKADAQRARKQAAESVKEGAEESHPEKPETESGK